LLILKKLLHNLIKWT